MPSEVKLRLIFSSNNLSSEQINKVVNFKPSKTWNCGDLVHPLAKNRHKDNGCQLEFTDSSLSSAGKRMMSALDKQILSLKKLPNDIEVDLSCIVNVENNSVPELFFNTELIQFAASIRAALDIDIYILE